MKKIIILLLLLLIFLTSCVQPLSISYKESGDYDTMSDGSVDYYLNGNARINLPSPDATINVEYFNETHVRFTTVNNETIGYDDITDGIITYTSPTVTMDVIDGVMQNE